MQTMIGKSFDSISKRIVYNYICQIPNFRPLKTNEASELSQQQMYDFVCSFFETLYINPGLLGLSIEPDECESHTLPGKNYLETRKLMRSDMKKIDDILLLIQFIGQYGDIKDDKIYIDKDLAKLNKPKLTNLAVFGIQSEVSGNNVALWNTKHPDMLSGWKLLSSVASKSEDEKLGIFYHCLFDTEYNFGLERYFELTNDKISFQKVVDYVTVHGFKLTTSKNKEMKVHFEKHFENGVEINFSLYYDLRHYNQIYYNFVSNKNTYKYFLNRFNELDKYIQELFVRTTNKCRACGFCNQRNRNLPLAFIECTYEGTPIRLCYYFQYIRFNYLEERPIAGILHFYDYVQKVLTEVHPNNTP